MKLLKSIVILFVAVMFVGCSAKIEGGGPAPAPYNPKDAEPTQDSPAEQTLVVGVSGDSSGNRVFVKDLTQVKENTMVYGFSYAPTADMKIGLDNISWMGCSGLRYNFLFGKDDGKGGVVNPIQMNIFDSYSLVAGSKYRILAIVEGFASCSKLNLSFAVNKRK